MLPHCRHSAQGGIKTQNTKRIGSPALLACGIDDSHKHRIEHLYWSDG